MVKEALFSRNDTVMLEHLPRSHFEREPFGNDMILRQARSRLRRKIENEAVPFLMTHLHEWQGVETALEHGLVEADVKTKLQAQIWEEKEELIHFLLKWIPSDKLGEFLEHMFAKSYPYELVRGQGSMDPFAPMTFWGSYLSQLEFEDQSIEKHRQQLLRDLESFYQTTSSKRSIVRIDFENDDPRVKVWTMSPERFDHIMAYDKLDESLSFAYVMPSSVIEQEGHRFVSVFYCDIQWHPWIMSIAYERYSEGKKSATYNHLMNAASQYISYHIRSVMAKEQAFFGRSTDSPNVSLESFEKTILRLMNYHFDHYRTNEPGRPSTMRSRDQGIDNSDGYDNEIKSFLEYLGRQGRKGRRVPLDELGNPDPGEGRGFKGFLRKKINDLVKIGFLEPVGKGFSITDEGLDVLRHRRTMGMINTTRYTSFDQMKEGLEHYAQKYPERSEGDVLRAIIKVHYPDVNLLNAKDVLQMIKQDHPSPPNVSVQGGAP